MITIKLTDEQMEKLGISSAEDANKLLDESAENKAKAANAESARLASESTNTDLSKRVAALESKVDQLESFDPEAFRAEVVDAARIEAVKVTADATSKLNVYSLSSAAASATGERKERKFADAVKERIEAGVSPKAKAVREAIKAEPDLYVKARENNELGSL